MESKVMLTTNGSLLCLCDDRGTIIGWIPFPRRYDAVGPGRGKVFLARPTIVQTAATARADSSSRAA